MGNDYSIEKLMVPLIVAVMMLFGWGALSALCETVTTIEQVKMAQAEQVKAILKRR